MTEIPLLTTEGDAFARGLAHGARFAREIADNVGTYLRRFAASGLDRDAAFVEAERWLRAIGAENPSYAEEMRESPKAPIKTARPSRCSTRYEVAFTLFGQEAVEGATKEDAGSRARRLYHLACCPTRPRIATPGSGRTGTGSQACTAAPSCCVQGAKTPPSFVCLTEAGIAGGKMGSTNAASASPRTAWRRATTAAIPIASRSTCAAARRCSTRKASRMRRCRRPTPPSTCSANFVIGAAGGKIVDIETSPDHTARLYPKDGIITHSNHFLTPGHGESLLEKLAPNTLDRIDRMRAAGAASGRDLLRPYAGRGTRPSRRALRDLPPSRSAPPARRQTHHDDRRGADRYRGLRHARGQWAAVRERVCRVYGLAYRWRMIFSENRRPLFGIML